MGRKFNILIRSRLPLVEDPEILAYVEGIVERLRVHMPPQPFPIRVGVIRHGALNAFAGPGGHIFVHTGLLQHLDNESEFAGVVAHELAHVSQRHIASRIEKAQIVNLASLLGILAGVFLGGEAQSAMVYGSVAAGQSAMLAYSREDEREADQVGMNYLVAAGFPPQGMVQSFEAIRKLRWLGGSFPLYLSTHPGVEERISYLKDRVDRMPPEVRNRQEHNTAYQRARMLVMARYTDPDKALAFFRDEKLDLCLNTLGKAIALDRANQILEARSAFEQALTCAPGDSLVLREAGDFFLRQGDFDVAARHLQDAVLRNPKDQLALYHYARVRIALGQPAEAIPLLERILAQLPEQSAVHALLGRVQGQEGRLFSAHLHLAYAALYSRDKRQYQFHLTRAQEHSRAARDEADLSKLREAFKEREDFL
ncbi:M48 family metalloprotease [Desulfonatronum sp. SC1]|uniref:beta-barrel assembly-enhancing protease n=1 Tax=Desulfonatronum sp. SC1 TaxID=2109626 RepID=UPI001304EC72|nr:M48 family metalloprotease [Desulfonatronum sp. SC1]